MAHDHSHPDPRSTPRRRMQIAVGITVAYLAVEVVGAWLSGSLSLAADAAHMFMDVGALLLAWSAMALAGRSSTDRHTFGFLRAEVLAAFVNAQILLVLSIWFFYEAAQRIANPTPIHVEIMGLVALGGLVANGAAAAALYGVRAQSINVRAAYLEVVTDGLTSLGVVAMAVLIPRTGWLWLDPAWTVVIGIVIVPRALRLLREAGHILLEGAPRHLDVDDLRKALLARPGIQEVHDLHLWTLTSGVHSLSVHVTTREDAAPSGVLQDVQDWLRDEMEISHATVQVEPESGGGCPPDEIHGGRLR